MNPLHQTSQPFAFRVLLRIAAVMVCCGIARGQVAHAQGLRSDDQKPYRLQNVKVTEVESTLATLLPAGTQIAVDPRGNQVWIRGSAQTHQAAQEIISYLDLPNQQTPAPAPVPASKPEIRVYPAKIGEAGGLAARWNAGYGGSPGVRIVADARASQ